MATQWKWQRRDKKLASKKNKMSKHGKGQAQLYADVINKKIHDLEKKHRIVKDIDEFATVASQQKLPKYSYGAPSYDNNSSFSPEMKEFGTVSSGGFTPTYNYSDKKKKILNSIDSLLLKERIYIAEESQAPKGAVVQTGKRGGKYYESERKKSYKSFVPQIKDLLTLSEKDTLNKEELTKFYNSKIRNFPTNTLPINIRGWADDAKDIFTDVLNNALLYKTDTTRFYLVKSKRGLEGGVVFYEEPKDIYVGYLTTSPWNIDHLKSRVEGVGSNLLAKVFKIALEKNKKVTLTSLTRAFPFYEKIGFKGKGYDLTIDTDAMRAFLMKFELKGQKIEKENDLQSLYDLESKYGVLCSKKLSILNKISKLHESKIDEIEEEAEEKEPKTELQEKILGTVENFEEKMIQNFINEYEKLAILSKEYSNKDLGQLFILAKSVDKWKNFNLSMPQEIDRLEQVIFIDSVAHNLHKQKFSDGTSLYKQLDDLADISKSIGENSRDDRLLLLRSIQNARKVSEYAHLDVLQKSSLLEKSKSLWSLFEKAIKIGIEKLSNKEIILLREWIYSKI